MRKHSEHAAHWRGGMSTASTLVAVVAKDPMRRTSIVGVSVCGFPRHSVFVLVATHCSVCSYLSQHGLSPAPFRAAWRNIACVARACASLAPAPPECLHLHPSSPSRTPTVLGFQRTQFGGFRNALSAISGRNLKLHVVWCFRNARSSCKTRGAGGSFA